jgi:hypothetical protein
MAGHRFCLERGESTTGALLFYLRFARRVASSTFIRIQNTERQHRPQLFYFYYGLYVLSTIFSGKQEQEN